MVLTRTIKDETGTVDLCETYSDENYRLRQDETGVVYGASVVDVIAGYDDHGKPYSRYHYIETDKKDESEESYNA